jgi:hypothetical protein
MRKVYCDVCGNESENFIGNGGTWHSGFATVEFTNGIKDVCENCSRRFENALRKEWKKIKEEFENEKDTKKEND